ncbi:molybdenum cofactor guanylyltransferase [Oleidesulfovibrio sp.]|uniref:molybdenum cofactor guanylyltransferase n=1 Tax=Oleidesulfovibrio sp. TaxID=2909707 RepID=UPI003A861261
MSETNKENPEAEACACAGFRIEIAHPACTVAILGGGKGQRLAVRLNGSSKWLLEIKGRTIRDRQLAVLHPFADEMLFAGGDCNEADMLPEGIRCVPDILPVKGPMAGLHSALVHASNDLVLVVPCDAPFLKKSVLQHLLQLALTAPQAPAVVPRQADGFWMPLLAVYRRACIPYMEALASEGTPHVFRLFERMQADGMMPVAPQVETLKAVDPELESFANINTPDDLDAMQAGNTPSMPELATRPKRW